MVSTERRGQKPWEDITPNDGETGGEFMTRCQEAGATKDEARSQALYYLGMIGAGDPPRGE